MGYLIEPETKEQDEALRGFLADHGAIGYRG